MKTRALLILASLLSAPAQADPPPPSTAPPAIQAIMDKPLYKGALWGLRVVDHGQVKVDLHPTHPFYIGSVRKIFTVGELLDQVGVDKTYDTPVFRTGSIDAAGVLQGNLVLVASGDLTMGGRTLPNGKVAVTEFDHNESDSLGNSQLTTPDPLAGYRALAKQVAASGVKQIKGDVVIDDRLFQPYFFRDQFNVRPIFVNDDMVDMTINPTTPGQKASLVTRPVSKALAVTSQLMTGPKGSQKLIDFNELPQNIGQPGASVAVTGNLPVDFVPFLTNKFPLIQTVRIVQPSNYARTVFIEALQEAGVRVEAPAVAENPVKLLPAPGAYPTDSRLALLRGMPYSEDARYILKISYNIGADTSLLLFGLTQGVDNMQDALRVERAHLASRFGIAENSFTFFDGSGGHETSATNSAVTNMLEKMEASPAFPAFDEALPSLGVDGSLGFVTDFRSDPSLAGATGQVHAKVGSYVMLVDKVMMAKGQAIGGYIVTRSGKRLEYQLVVNNVPITGLPDLLQIFQDQGRISAILWRDN